MSKKIVDGVIKDWGERLYPTPVRGRKWQNPKSGFTPSKAPEKPRVVGFAGSKLASTVRKSPEVMVKISGGGKNIGRIKAHMDYISRNGKVELEDERGEIYTGTDGVREACRSWRDGKYAVPLQGEKRREAFNIVLSMPPGTDREGVHAAARKFASEEFSNHQYVFAAHNDEKHPHVHLSVKAVGHDGKRLNPRKADLQAWRELFAEKLREQGIEANATPRRARGVVRKSEPQAVLHIDKGYEAGKRSEPSKVTQARERAAREALKKGQGTELHDALKKSRALMQRDYGEAARELARGGEKERKLSLEVARFIQEMGPIETKMDLAIKRLTDKSSTKTVEKEQEQEQSRDKQERDRL